ncbi:MAG: amino acid permease [Bacteroidia bacterium]
MNLFRKKSISKILSDVAKGEAADSHGSLGKHLGVRDLTAFGIAAIIGAGIFSTIGNASASGGPGVIFLFLFTAVACGFAAFAYAEFASMVPVSGSAYTYSYVAFGEVIAWIIGWALIMEYGIGNITVAISWSDYFTGFMEYLGVHIPEWATMDYFSAHTGFDTANTLMLSGKKFENLTSATQEAHTAWLNAPLIGSFHVILDIPAIVMTFLVSGLVYIGIRESRNASNIMVAIKIAIVLLVIIVGVFYVDTKNYHPFLPNGMTGVLKGVSAVFFAYIGFDAISTTAEECKNPQRDLPRSMMYSIIICTILYVCISLVLTGMVHYSDLGVGDPLAFVFEKLHITWMIGIVGLSAVVAMTSVFLVFQLGQPRIWMSMSRDGLLPPAFSRIHPKFKTPSFATGATCLIVAIPTLFLNMSFVTDMVSIGTLFAFVLVCGGVLKLENTPEAPKGKFKTPYFNSKFVMPALVVLGIALCFIYNGDDTKAFLKNSPKMFQATSFVTSLDAEDLNTVSKQIGVADPKGYDAVNNDLEAYLTSLDRSTYQTTIKSLSIEENKKFESGFDLFKHKIPTWIFFIITGVLTFIAFTKNLSLIPLLGLESCLYMMSELGYKNWMYFSGWLAIGLIIYFGYSYRNSKLQIEN